jgi:hypothetical protein
VSFAEGGAGEESQSSLTLSEFASFELSLGFAGESVLVKSGFADDCNPSNFEFSSFLTVFDMFLILGLTSVFFAVFAGELAFF